MHFFVVLGASVREPICSHNINIDFIFMHLFVPDLLFSWDGEGDMDLLNKIEICIIAFVVLTQKLTLSLTISLYILTVLNSFHLDLDACHFSEITDSVLLLFIKIHKAHICFFSP